jgi:glycolate oxidase FAD binding subunit
VSTEAIAAQVREAASSGRKLRISGAGSWMNAGRPTAADQAVSLSDDAGVVEYVPDDVTITVRAGTTLEEIANVTRANNQWLPLDPPGGGGGTIGAAIATASSGPLAHSFGFARDLILGLEFVSGKGDVVRSGGRVVKNVAGFDMMRVMCGAWGTLGVITQATLRLYALPKIDRTFAVAVTDTTAALERFVADIGGAPLAPLAMELVSAPLASRLGLPHRAAVLIRVGGNERLVDAQVKALSKFGEHTELGADVWGLLSSAHSSVNSYSMRLSALPGNISHTWARAHEIAGSDESALFHATLSRGIARVAGSFDRVGLLPRTDASARVSYEVLPPKVWETVSPSVVSDRLSSNVKRAFDPHFILNPGILG